MLDLIFAVLMVIIIVQANKGKVNDLLCNIALVIGILAGILGLVQAFFTDSDAWILHILVMLISFALKFVARHFAKLYNQRIEEIQAEYERATRLHSRDFDSDKPPVYTEENFDDPNIRFGGGDGTPLK